MSIFITQGNYTGQAIKGMVDKPEDRKGAVAALMESVGAKLLQYYVTSGKYDFMVIAEGDSLSDVMAGLLIAGSSGSVTNLITTQAMTTQEAKSAMEKAKLARGGFKGAGVNG
ncbi:GYD domain-containing protein [Sedimenticola hydrogenitrophicus]|uniref:GYD domain-containing protein n=1 Tax=Sedimenticola hydrogenitrophicus TaxID=2967975 RepID=UPI0021A547E4|nr:GYD domain-containing protein [Sedimenticola hydrogenitrophicus]